MHRFLLIFVAAVGVSFLGCEEAVTPVISSTPLPPIDTTTVFLGGTVDITDGIRSFRNVQIYGALTFQTTFYDDLARSSGETAGGRVGVFLNVHMAFKRMDDYQGVSQNWHAGGKSYEVLDLREDDTALTHKRYQLWGIPNIAFVNIVFLVQRSDVRVDNLWISYEY